MKKLHTLAMCLSALVISLPSYAEKYEKTTIFVQNDSNELLVLRAIDLTEAVPEHSRKEQLSVVNHAYIASYPNGTYACSWFIDKNSHGKIIDGIIYKHVPGTKPICSYVTHQQ